MPIRNRSGVWQIAARVSTKLVWGGTPFLCLDSLCLETVTEVAACVPVSVQLQRRLDFCCNIRESRHCKFCRGHKHWNQTSAPNNESEDPAPATTLLPSLHLPDPVERLSLGATANFYALRSRNGINGRGGLKQWSTTFDSPPINAVMENSVADKKENTL